MCPYLLAVFQFNCSLRQLRSPSDFQDQLDGNATFNMELYNTDLFLVPSPGVFSVAENEHVYVEVRLVCYPRVSGPLPYAAVPWRLVPYAGHVTLA